MERDEWQELWEARRLSELAVKIRAAAGDGGTAHAEYATKLAACGALTLAEGLAAAQQGGGEADLPSLLRAGAAAGATAWARALIDSRLADNRDPNLALLRDQLESGLIAGSNREHWKLISQIGSMSAEEAAQKLDALLAEDPAWASPKDYAQLASIWQAAQRYEDAVRIWARCIARWPRGDGHGSIRLEHALCTWLAGQPEAARAALLALRENTDAERFARGVARRLIAELERNEADGAPRWTVAERRPSLSPPGHSSGAAARNAALELAGISSSGSAAGPIDSFAALRFELEANGLSVWRLNMDEGAIASCLESGATVVVGEERPLGAGFAVVTGIETTWNVLEIAGDDRIGSRLRWRGEQWDRSAFHGRSALLVLGAKERAKVRATALAKRGIAHDERIDLIDACDLDETGNKPHGARVEGLTALAVERAPEVPKCWQRRGSALLALLVRGDLDDSENGDFQRWYADARGRFEHAEWAHQLVAEALEYQDNYDEAGIAWSDAALLDDKDYRNYLGMARVRAATGLTGAAESSVNRALVLEPSSAPAWSLAARLALSRDDIGTAKIAADLATSLAPDEPSMHTAAALVHEQADEPSAALTSLCRAHELRPNAPGALSRLTRRYVHAASWQEASAMAEAFVESGPGYSASWTLASQVAFASGEVEKAVAIARQGIEVTGPYGDLVAALSKAFSALPSEPGDSAALVPLLAPSSDAPYYFADVLLSEDAVESALAIYDALGADDPDEVDPRWRRARALLRAGPATHAPDGETISLLLSVCEKAGPFPYPRVLAGWLLAEDDPQKSLELIAEADSERDPAIVWSSLRHVLSALGRTDDAAEIDGRLANLGQNALLAAARSLAEFGLGDAARQVIDSSPWIEDSFDRWMSEAVLASEANHYESATSSICKALEIDAEASAGRFGARTAFLAGRWTEASRWLEPICRQVARESGSDFEDPWALRAMHALAESNRGENERLGEVLSAASSHPDVLRSIALADRIGGAAKHTDVAARLADVAPAWASAVAKKELGT